MRLLVTHMLQYLLLITTALTKAQFVAVVRPVAKAPKAPKGSILLEGGVRYSFGVDFLVHGERFPKRSSRKR